MNVHISYKSAKAPDVEREFSHHIQKLQRRLQVYRPELIHLHGIVDHNSARKSEMLISLNLRLPSGQLAAQESGPTAVAAMKQAFSELTKQLTKHKEQLRGQHFRGVRKLVQNRSPQVPFEETLAAVHPAITTGDDINSFINANLAKLERFIARELAYRVNSGALRSDEVSTEEVLDEAVASALGDGEEKPELLSMERWIYRLALRTIDRFCRAPEISEQSSVHLEQSARKPNVRASDEPELQYHQPDEMFLQENIIADTRISNPEQIAASDEMISSIEKSLLDAKREDREALILYAIEGFTVEEIAATTDRDAEVVKASIQSARDHVKQNLPASGHFRDALLRASKIA